MRCIRKIPLGFVRKALFIIIVIAVIHMFWSLRGSGDVDGPNKLVTSHSGSRAHRAAGGLRKQNINVKEWQIQDGQPNDKQPNEEQMKSHDNNIGDNKSPGVDYAKDAVCDEVIPFRQHSPDTISTFDLPSVTNYTMDKVGRYLLPDEVWQAGDTVPNEPVHVTLVPFSHSDPGYGNTMEGYYQMSTRSVLNNMVQKLDQYRNMTFQWVETVFLERWWREIDSSTRQKTRDLIRRGQLEIVLGGWVMPDEAVTHYTDVIDQVIEGHQWLREHLDVTPTNGWINDPFGFSSTMPYIWQASGMENMVILRIHQAIKATLMKMKSLEFNWRPYWKYDSSSDILTNIMPYENYWNSDVCHPDQAICKQFNFLYLGRHDSGGVAVSDSNIKEQSKKLYDAYRFTANMYQYNNLVIFIGEDNSFSSPQSWDDTYTNYEKLAKFINAKTEWRMNIKFGTLKDYFAGVRRQEKKFRREQKSTFPVLSGDFFPYSDRENAYWTGYFTTRLWVKKLSRELGSLLRAADGFSVIAYNHCVASGKCSDISVAYKSIVSSLQIARRELGMYQHHDGITGTSLPHVVADYEARLMKGYTNAQQALKTSLVSILSRGEHTDPALLTENRLKTDAKAVLKNKLHKVTEKGVNVLIANPTERSRLEIVNILLDTKDVNMSIGKKTDITFQASTRHSVNYQSNPVYLISFCVDLIAYEVVTVTIKRSGTANTDVIEQEQYQPTTAIGPLAIENDYMTAKFNTETGMLERVTHTDGRKVEIRAEFLRYRSQLSGAYLFGPAGPAEEIKELKSDFKTFVTKGPLFSEVTYVHDAGFTQTLTLYNVTGVQGYCLHVTNEVDLNQGSFHNSEIILRLDTNVKNNNLFFTDQNGFQLMGRMNYADRPIETNYYPVTSMAVIDDQNKRVTLHCAQPHGVSSLEEGSLEVMLDRNMMRDDGRGLGMGATEKIRTKTDFVLQFEFTEKPYKRVEQRFTYASASSSIINELLQNELRIFSVSEKGQAQFDNAIKMTRMNTNPLPCDVSIANLRQLITKDFKYNSTSVVLHRKSMHCEYPFDDLLCSETDDKLTMTNLVIGLKKPPSMTETSLTHSNHIADIFGKDDIGPNSNEMRTFVYKAGH